MINVRAIAARSVHNAIFHKCTLQEQTNNLTGSDRALWQELTYGTLRHHIKLLSVVSQMIEKTIKGKNAIINTLLEIGFYQLVYTKIPTYAVINETVNAASELQCDEFKGMVNAVLRKMLTNQDQLLAIIKKETEIYSHPQWLIKRIKKDYPKQYKDILEANNKKAPIWLRINLTKISLSDYVCKLEENNIAISEIIEPSAIKLANSVSIPTLPGFEDGLFYVQDISAQKAIHYLNPKPKERILDACAAPGGKTTHILEYCNGDVNLTALDVKPQRLEKLKENLKRQNWSINVIAGSAEDPESWWDGIPFDKILLDAPCSGTGVIRRHPEIKYIRSEDEIHSLANLQSIMLESLWNLLKIGGCLLYTTCSILKEENSTQINNFIYKHKNEVICEELPVKQQITGENDRDGFFYTKLIKKASN